MNGALPVLPYSASNQTGMLFKLLLKSSALAEGHVRCSASYWMQFPLGSLYTG